MFLCEREPGPLEESCADMGNWTYDFIAHKTTNTQLAETFAPSSPRLLFRELQMTEMRIGSDKNASCVYLMFFNKYKNLI